MKRQAYIAGVFVAATGLFGTGLPSIAFGAELPGWDRPIFTAHMNVVDSSSGQSATHDVELTMTQQDGQRSPTGLVLLIDGRTTEFAIRQTREDRCGGARFVGVPESGTTIENVSLVLEEQSEGSCLDPEAGKVVWRASVLDMDRETLKLEGEPEPVMTIQN